MVRSSGTARLAVGLLAAFAAWQAVCFLAAPRSSPAALRGPAAAQAAAVAAAMASAPAHAVEQTGDGFQTPELIAIFTPPIFLWAFFSAWEAEQPDADTITGAAQYTVPEKDEQRPGIFRGTKSDKYIGVYTKGPASDLEKRRM